MGEIFKLFGTIGIDNGEANNALSETEKKGESTGSKLAGFFKKAAVAIGTAFAVGKLINFGKLSVEAAASAQALSAQFTQVFGDLEPKAQKMIDSMGEQMNILPNRIKPTFSKITSMFKGLGLDTETAMKKSEQATTLAADAAAFYDVSLEDASGSLTSFLKGNYEAGESIGVFANDTQMAQFAISQGVVGSTKEWASLDEATKQATRLDYANNMLEQAGAVGQATREADGYENVMGNVKQAWQDFLAIVGAPLLGTVVDVLKKVTDGLQDLGGKAQEVMQWFSDLTGEIANSTAWSSFKELIQPITDAFGSLKDTLAESNFLGETADKFSQIKDAILGIDFMKMAEDAGALADKFLPLIAFVGTLAAGFGIYSLALGIKSAAETVAIVSMYAMDAATKILAGTMAFLTSPVTLVVAAIAALVAIGVLLYQNWDTIGPWLAGIWETIKTKAIEIWTAISDFFTGIWDAIKAVAETVWEAITGFLSTAWDNIKTVAETVWGAISAFFSAVWEGIKTIFTVVVTIIAVIIGTAMDLWKNTIGVAMQWIRDKIKAIWDGIVAFLSPILSTISNFISTAWNTITNVTNTVWNGIKTFFSTIWNGISSVISTVVNAIKNAISTAWNAISSVTSSVFNGIKNVASSVWNGIKSTISNVVDGIKSTVSSVWNGIKSTTTSVWEGIKSAISKPINAAKDLVKGVIDKIKGFFSFSISWPKIPMPHFGINPSGWKIGDLLKGSIPTLGIDWYAKGGIMTSPTMFGANGTNAMVGGEAGQEAVLPLNSKNLGMIGQGIAAEMGYSQNAVVAKLDELIIAIKELFEQFADLTVVMDSGELVGALKQKINQVLGSQSSYEGRGL